MKLIERTNYYYLVFTLFIFALGTVLFYFLMRNVLLDGIDEALHQEKVQLVEHLQLHNVPENIPQSKSLQINVRPVAAPATDLYETVVIINAKGELEDFRQLTGVYKHGNTYYEIVLKQSLAEAESLIENILPLEVLLFLLLLAGVLIISRQVSRTVWQPFYSLLEKLQNYDLGQMGVIYAESTRIDEFDALNEGIEKMTMKISNDFQSHKEFNENSAHELQTPIAIIKNKLELLIQSPNISEADMGLIESMFDALRRLSLVNRGLILLSKIDNEQYSDTTELSVQKSIERLLENIGEFIVEKEIKLDLEFEDECWIKTNSILLDILLTNLLTNSVKHNISRGQIFIRVEEGKLTIMNTGKPLTVDPSLLFKRFKKDSDMENSVGLGLAVVKKISDHLAFTIDYHCVEDKHIITVVF